MYALGMTYFHGSTVALQVGDLILPGTQTGNGIHSRIDHIYMTRVVEDYAGSEHGTYICATGKDTDNYCNALDEDGEGIRGTEDYALGAALFWAITGRRHRQYARELNCDNPVAVYEVEPMGEILRDDYPELGPEIVKSLSPARIVRIVSQDEIDRVMPHVINARFATATIEEKVVEPDTRTLEELLAELFEDA